VSHSELVTIIVVNWNGKPLLGPCLEALFRQTYGAYEVIVVDNGSSDGSVQFVRECFPAAKVIELLANHGFTGGNLEGLKQARGSFIALVNNDAVVDERWLEELVRPMLHDERVGLCASKILVSGTTQINSAGDGLTTAGVGFHRGLGKDPSWFTQPERVFGSCAAAALYRRTMFEDIGFFDEDFFLYDEDLDLNFRALLAGWRCVYVPTAVAYHRENATAGRLSDLHVYYHSRNLEFVWVKNMPARLMLRFAHHKVIQEVGSFCYLCLRHGKWRPFFRAKRDAVRLLPVMLAKRKTIQRRKRVSDQEVRAWLTPIWNRELLSQKVRQMIWG
jgi:GT2 family glycosyltransferase